MNIRISQHAFQQMFKREISIEVLKEALLKGTVIRTYENDKPYPSNLLLYMEGDFPLHVVYADNVEAGERIIVTVYKPDAGLWNTDFRTKK